MAIYKAPFDPQRPLVNLIAASEVGPRGAGTVEVTVPLAAGVVYRVVTTLVRPQEGGDSDISVRNAISNGPGGSHFSAGFLDEPNRADDEIDLVLGEFCVEGSWSGPNASRGLIHPASRSELAGAFWFRDPLLRDLEVELLDRCANNGHWWVVLSGSTTLGFNLRVRIIDVPNLSKSYSHPRGQRLTTRVDRKAFRCEDVRAARGVRPEER